MNTLVSIIVPVYNTERYLEKCINSILNQSYTDFEVLLINDCSTDSSKEICMDFAAKDKRIRFVDKQRNEGLSAARNTGLDLAGGGISDLLIRMIL